MFKKQTALEISGFIILIFLFSSGPAWGSGISNARALGMGGAYTAAARGLDAPYWNPANLGLSDGNSYSIGLFSAGAGLKNNSLTLGEYNKYNGSFLDDQDKAHIMSSVPGDGLKLEAMAEVSALNFSVNNFSFVSKGYWASNLNIGHDPLELMLYGNAVVDEISMKNTYGEGYGIIDMAASYGRSLIQWEDGELAVGGSLHYFRGLVYKKIIEAEGMITTTDTGFVGDGHVSLLSSTGGSGSAIDLGVAIIFDSTWNFSGVWQNSYSRLNWNDETETRIVSFNMEPTTAQGYADSTINDSLITGRDTTVAAESFSSDLPSTMKLGLAKSFPGLLISLDWEQALESRPGTGINPRVALGVEYKAADFLPLRAGMSTGGRQGSLYSIGFGLHFGQYHFDIAMANSGSPLPTYTKGAMLAAGMGLYF